MTVNFIWKKAVVAYLLFYSAHYFDMMLQDIEFVFLQFQNCQSQYSTEPERDFPNIVLGLGRDPFI
jgi:hypothetical protein